ncbi:hypothetical protein BKG82_26145 [Mycobacteroides chelonae]|uniref:Uncharacterized protein n=1 Tax=Mycobacteroides chelonae TaxID=1774 RepID=A0A1S1LIH6_MYCCH|nr:hypothetical protein BKG82_26145 [Mycobacteroides chelonae]
MTGCYDIDLQSSGSGWLAAFGKSVLSTAANILEDGPFGPVEVTYTKGSGVRTFVGVLLTVDAQEGTVTAEPYPRPGRDPDPDMSPRTVAIDDIVRFRA